MEELTPQTEQERLRVEFRAAQKREQAYVERLDNLFDNLKIDPAVGMEILKLEIFQIIEESIEEKLRLAKLIEDLKNQVKDDEKEIDNMILHLNCFKKYRDILKERIEGLFDEVSHDFLTKLSSRRSMDEEFTRVLAHLRRHSNENAVVIKIDCDNFKRINEEYGEENGGDTALQKLGKIIKNEMREEDMAARWGGDEFYIICRDTDVSSGEVLAERIMSCVASCEVECPNGNVIEDFTVSIAVISFREKNQTIRSPETIRNIADDVLKVSKRNGKNRISIEEPS